MSGLDRLKAPRRDSRIYSSEDKLPIGQVLLEWRALMGTLCVTPQTCSTFCYAPYTITQLLDYIDYQNSVGISPDTVSGIGI